MPRIALALAALLAAGSAAAQEVGRVSVDWFGNDIVVESFADPKVAGVTCHIAYFDRSVIDRLQQGNWFEDPSFSAVDCSQTGPIKVGSIATGSKGESVFSEGQSLVFKSLRVTRLYDAPNRTLVYLAHANELTQGSGKMAISTIQLPPGTEP